jgi:hypothetical protein
LIVLIAIASSALRDVASVAVSRRHQIHRQREAGLYDSKRSSTSGFVASAS